MLNSSIVKTTAFHSVIGESSILAPESERKKRNGLVELLLTALIDAFSILVIFLLMNFSSTGELLMVGKGVELPLATGDVLERHPVVKVEDGQIFLEDKPVTADGLVQALLDLRENFTKNRPGEEFPAVLTVQADRRVKFENLSGVVQASAQAGFSDIKFAVVLK
ncbi:MAG: biopolymer transporter ExbD [Bdellovibrionales bacterium]|jgi:biopolymer transport protein ExbD|nr:biopolymer transporter ExbD [Bdellovibrionales bacterium]